MLVRYNYAKYYCKRLESGVANPQFSYFLGSVIVYVLRHIKFRLTFYKPILNIQINPTFLELAKIDPESWNRNFKQSHIWDFGIFVQAFDFIFDLEESRRRIEVATMNAVSFSITTWSSSRDRWLKLIL